MSGSRRRADGHLLAVPVVVVSQSHDVVSDGRRQRQPVDAVVDIRSEVETDAPAAQIFEPARTRPVRSDQPPVLVGIDVVSPATAAAAAALVNGILSLLTGERLSPAL